MALSSDSFSNGLVPNHPSGTVPNAQADISALKGIAPLSELQAPRDFKRIDSGTRQLKNDEPGVEKKLVASSPARISPALQRFEAAHHAAMLSLRALPLALRSCGGEGSARHLTLPALAAVREARDALALHLGCEGVCIRLDELQKQLSVLRQRNLRDGTTARALRALSGLSRAWWETLDDAESGLAPRRRAFGPLLGCYALAVHDLNSRPVDSEELRELLIAAVEEHRRELQRAYVLTRMPLSPSRPGRRSA